MTWLCHVLGLRAMVRAVTDILSTEAFAVNSSNWDLRLWSVFKPDDVPHTTFV